MRPSCALSLALVTAFACGDSSPNEHKDSAARAGEEGKAGDAKPATAAEPTPPPANERFSLDDAYAREHGYELPAKIEFEVPGAGADGELRRTSPPAEQRVFLRLDRTSADGRASEDLMLTSLTIPPGEPDERLRFTRELVETQGLPRAMPAGGSVLEVREIEVGGMPAVLGVGEFQAQNSGKVYTSMIAVILPEPQTVSIMAHHVANNSDVAAPADVGQKGLLAAALASMSIEP